MLISLALHLLAIGFPSDGTVFDETYYVKAANDILEGVASNPEHPFVGKLWGAIGIAIFGDNWFGWRIPIVAFGVLTLYVFYNLARHFLDERRALVATAFLSFETIFFMHSSLLLLDIPPLFFGILGFYFYCKDRYILSAVSLGMAILSKEWGILFVFALLAYHIFTTKPLSRRGLNVSRPMLIKTGKFVAVLILVVAMPLWTYAIIYKPGTDAEVRVTVIHIVDQEGNILETSTTEDTIFKGQISNPVDQILYIIRYQSGLTLKEDSKTSYWNNYAWGWIIPIEFEPPTYYQKAISIKVQTKVGEEVIEEEVSERRPISWRGAGNMIVWLGIWLVVPFAAINILKRKANKLDYLIIAWIIGTFLPWLYVSAVVERIVYAFYFVNVVPIIALGIPYFVAGVSRGGTEKFALLTWLGAAIIFFFYYYPVNVFDFASG